MARRLNLGIPILAMVLGACSFTQQKPMVAAECDKAVTVARYLVRKYHEFPIQFGPSNKGGSVMLFVGKETWTLVRIDEKGCATPLQAGHDWRRIVLNGQRT